MFECSIENEKIKSTKNDLEKENNIQYFEQKNEEIVKPEFTNLKIGKENFGKLK